MFVVAQISDLHFNGTAAHRDRIDAVLNYLNVECDGPKTIDALLVTGDLADEGLPAEYREAAETLSSGLNISTGGPYLNEQCYFFDCLRKGVKPVTVTPASAKQTIRVVKAEIESCRARKAIVL